MLAGLLWDTYLYLARAGPMFFFGSRGVTMSRHPHRMHRMPSCLILPGCLLVSPSNGAGLREPGPAMAGP